MATLNPFTPNSAGTITATVTAASQPLALFKGGNDQQVWVQSLAASAVAFIEFGPPSVVATIATGTPIQPGTKQLFTVGATQNTVAIIGTAGTVYFTTGQGTAP